MIDRVGKECCGCAACANFCPKHCIKMTANNEGFLYPQIQLDNCVNCGGCEKVCPVLSENVVETNDKRQAWAVINLNRSILMDSSSGGLFTALAGVVINEGGCVFGAAFTEDFSMIQHKMVEGYEELCILRGSKYMQSDVKDCYHMVRKQLSKDRRVLFSGTPCQIAGLKGFLGREYDRLICVDVICHGTPSALLWQHYLKKIEKKLSSRAVSVNFRDKTFGWKKYGLNITMEDEEIYHNSLHEDPFMRMFLKNVCLRESCYHCSVKERGIYSDITMGDLWGVEQIRPDIDSSLGVSLALIHTEKGRQLFEQAKGLLDVVPVDYERAVSHNPPLTNSVRRPPERDSFFPDLRMLSWNKLERRYSNDKISTLVRRKVSSSPIGTMKRAIFGK